MILKISNKFGFLKFLLFLYFGFLFNVYKYLAKYITSIIDFIFIKKNKRKILL